MPLPAATGVLDAVLDRTLLLGYSKVGPALRRRWWPADPEPGSLTGEHVVVTGATSGIGEAMVTSFADLGAVVHVLGRNPEKVQRVVGEVRAARPAAELVAEVCDVGDLDAVRAWTDDLTARLDGAPLRGIVHNAGAMTTERTESPQGHETGLAVHVLGPHLMTERLLPVLAGGPEGPGGSVVLMSSGGMYSAGLRSRPDEIEYRDGEYDGVRAYARTKRMQVELADAWNDRLRGGDVRVESCHPGWAATPGVTDSLPGFDKVMGPLLRDAASGGDTAVWLVATRPDSTGTHHFWHDRAPRPTTWPVQRPTDVAARRRFLTYLATATDTVWPA